MFTQHNFVMRSEGDKTRIICSCGKFNQLIDELRSTERAMTDHLRAQGITPGGEIKELHHAGSN